MKNKTLISRNQRKLLDGLCETFMFQDQVDLADSIWPHNFQYIRKSFSRLHNLGFIDWVPEHETSYGARWFATEKGVRYIVDTM